MSCVQQLVVWDHCVAVTACPICSGTTAFLCTSTRCPFCVVVFPVHLRYCSYEFNSRKCVVTFFFFFFKHIRIVRGLVYKGFRPHSFPSSGIHMNTSIQGTPAEYCTVGDDQCYSLKPSVAYIVADRWKGILSPAKTTTPQNSVWFKSTQRTSFWNIVPKVLGWFTWWPAPSGPCGPQASGSSWPWSQPGRPQWWPSGISLHGDYASLSPLPVKHTRWRDLGLSVVQHHLISPCATGPLYQHVQSSQSSVQWRAKEDQEYPTVK